MPVHDQDLLFLPACHWAVVPPVVHAALPAAVNVRIKSIKESLAFWRDFFLIASSFIRMGLCQIEVFLCFADKIIRNNNRFSEESREKNMLRLP